MCKYSTGLFSVCNRFRASAPSVVSCEACSFLLTDLPEVWGELEEKKETNKHLSLLVGEEVSGLSPFFFFFFKWAFGF